MRFSRAQQPTLDVEAAVRNDLLDVGLFGPSACLSHETAEKIMEKLQQQLTTLVESEETG